MYAGRDGRDRDRSSRVCSNPRHPYTHGLLDIDPLDREGRPASERDPWVVPHPFRMPAGCKFAPRCNYAWDTCNESEPD